MSTRTTILILGAGKFGTCLAQHLASLGNTVLLYCREESLAHDINHNHHNHRAYPSITLHHAIRAVTTLDHTLTAQCHIIVNAVPVQHHRELLTQLGPLLQHEHLYLNVSKGIDAQTGQLPSEILAAHTSLETAQRAVILFGPSFAEEILSQQPTAVVAASQNQDSTTRTQQVFHAPCLRVYSSTDPLGLEVAGALKNVIAIATGAARGLGLQSNAHAALTTRGLNEILKIGLHRGANPMTFLGLGGLGDLLLTCSSEKSRNFRIGKALGEGASLEAALQVVDSVAEGVHTAKSAYKWSISYQLDCPILTTVYQVLYENLNVREAMSALLERPSTTELDETALRHYYLKKA
ncbi:MAG: NAD(P)-dependent glycerol-3-phosphate dehydrogenase, partial [Gammaproteobacteria bacterium]